MRPRNIPNPGDLTHGRLVTYWPAQKRGKGRAGKIDHSPFLNDEEEMMVHIAGREQPVPIEHVRLESDLPKIQRTVLQAMYEAWKEAGTGVTLREVAGRLDKSPTTVQLHSDRLVDRGLVIKPAGRSGSLRPSPDGEWYLISGILP